MWPSLKDSKKNLLCFYKKVTKQSFPGSNPFCKVSLSSVQYCHYWKIASLCKKSYPVSNYSNISSGLFFSTAGRNWRISSLLPSSTIPWWCPIRLKQRTKGCPMDFKEAATKEFSSGRAGRSMPPPKAVSYPCGLPPENFGISMIPHCGEKVKREKNISEIRNCVLTNFWRCAIIKSRNSEIA